jgi:hypothetical protein
VELTPVGWQPEEADRMARARNINSRMRRAIPALFAGPSKEVARSAGSWRQDSQRPKTVGKYNASHLVVRSRHEEHWLNGMKVGEYEAESSQPESPILFAHHESTMWFRNIRVRRLH